MNKKRETAPPPKGEAVILTKKGQHRRNYPTLSKYVLPSAYSTPSYSSMVGYLLSLCLKDYHKTPFLSRRILLRNAKQLLEETQDFEGLMRTIAYCSEISKTPYTFKFVKLMYNKEFKENANRDTSDQSETKYEQSILPFV